MTPTGPLFIKPRRRVIEIWAAIAFVNLAVGVAVALQPESADFRTMIGWARQWLIEGHNVYAPDIVVDYPPHAIVLLSPLGTLPASAALPLWMILNLGLVVIAPYFAARFFAPHAPFRTILLPILMFASWWGSHTLVQFSLLALTFSMAALSLAERRPLASGICLGLGLMKPQVAVPVFLWTLFTRRWRIAVVALITAAAGVALFCLRVGAEPIGVVRRWVEILRFYYMGDTPLTGASDLRPFIHSLISNVYEVDAIAVFIGLALLAGISVAGFLEGRWRRRSLYAAPPLAACWSLLTFYHLSYGFVVLLPAFMLLFFNDTQRTRLRKAVFWLLQIGLMIDIPGVARRAGVSAGIPLRAAIANADRALILLLFVGLVTLAWQEGEKAR